MSGLETFRLLLLIVANMGWTIIGLYCWYKGKLEAGGIFLCLAVLGEILFTLRVRQ